jgi:hypothetical protein
MTDPTNIRDDITRALEQQPDQQPRQHLPLEDFPLETLDDMVNYGTETTRHCFDTDGRLVDTLVWVTADDFGMALRESEGALPDEDFLKGLSLYFESIDVQRYLFLCEREGKVWLHAEDGSSAQSASMSILRSEGGRKSALTPPIKQSEPLIGPFAGLLRGRPKALLRGSVEQADHVCGVGPGADRRLEDPPAAPGDDSGVEMKMSTSRTNRDEIRHARRQQHAGNPETCARTPANSRRWTT